MLDSAQIQKILLFPLRDQDARKKFLTASLVALAGLVIPILPGLVLYGYCARMMRKVIDENQEPSMPEWTDWNEMLVDGLRLFVVRLAITLPATILLVVGLSISFVPIILMAAADPESSQSSALAAFVILGNCAWIAIFLLAILIIVPLTVMLGCAEGHVVSKRSIAAVFQVGEWWPIFRKNIGGFVISYLVVMAISTVGSLAIQILMYTIILICILPFVLMPYSAYLQLILWAFFARAYAQGREALQSPPAA